MQRLFSFFLVAIFTVLLAGCGSKLTSENLGKVETGMTEQQVKEILGSPTRVETGTVLGVTGTTYYYKSGDKEVKIVFVNGKVMTKAGSL